MLQDQALHTVTSPAMPRLLSSNGQLLRVITAGKIIIRCYRKHNHRWDKIYHLIGSCYLRAKYMTWNSKLG